MKIIDKENMQRLRKEDPVKKKAEKDEETQAKEFSPMDPPEVDEAPGKVEEVPYEEMPRALQLFMDEHENAVKHIEEFENELTRFKEGKWVIDQDMGNTFQHFFSFIDENILDHNSREEKFLFPLLHQRLIESGEHGQISDQQGDYRTGIDIMEDDHVKFIQLSTLVFNFFGLAAQLPDVTSQSLVSDLAYEKGRELAELLRLHIEREDTILFPQAKQLITDEEFTQMAEEMEAEMNRQKETDPEA